MSISSISEHQEDEGCEGERRVEAESDCRLPAHEELSARGLGPGRSGAGRSVQVLVSFEFRHFESPRYQRPGWALIIGGGLSPSGGLLDPRVSDSVFPHLLVDVLEGVAEATTVDLSVG